MADRFDDTTPVGVPPPQMAVHPDNRQLVDDMTVHVLALKGTVRVLRLLIRQIYAAKEAIPTAEVQSIERALLEMADRCNTAAAAVAACRKEPTP